MAHQFSITTTWNGQQLPPADHISITLTPCPDKQVVLMDIDAPLYNSPAAPSRPAGEACPQLWDYEVIPPQWWKCSFWVRKSGIWRWSLDRTAIICCCCWQDAATCAVTSCRSCTPARNRMVGGLAELKFLSPIFHPEWTR
eukprot:m.145058 g.145058  ORF g.145058 m.145058 type:complete len:141 (-) comp20482_c1_seq6:206-628(-)